MVLSRRERTIAIVTAVVVGALAIDRLALTPLLAKRDSMEAAKAKLTLDLNSTRRLMATRRELAPRWNQMIRTTLKDDVGQAESQVLNRLSAWARECGVKLSLMKPERLMEKSQLPQITFQAPGTGTAEALAKLLYKVQTADIPIKVIELGVSSPKEGSEELSLTLRISTIYLPPPPPGRQAPKPEPLTQPAAGAPVISLAGAKIPWDSYRVIVVRNMFSRNRSAPRPRVPQFIAPPPPPPPEIRLAGVMLQGKWRQAFFESSAGGAWTLGVGQQIKGRTLTDITVDGVELNYMGATSRIAVDQTLTGQAPRQPLTSSSAAATTSGSGTADSRPSTQPSSGSAPPSSQTDILERMRQRRLQELVK